MSKQILGNQGSALSHVPPIIYINVHVGTALYFGWTSCAAIVSGVSLLVYDVGLAMDISCYIGLVILLTVLIIWFSLETFAFDRQLRYMYRWKLFLFLFICALLSN